MDTKNQTKTTRVIKKKVTNKTIREKLPEHLVNLVSIIKNNAEIRRFTSLEIINALKKEGVITTDKAFIIFGWTKYTVKTNGLGTDFRYNNDIFLNALVQSFDRFAVNASNIISTFINMEDEKDNSSSPVNEENINEEEVIESVNAE